MARLLVASRPGRCCARGQATRGSLCPPPINGFSPWATALPYPATRGPGTMETRRPSISVLNAHAAESFISGAEMEPFRFSPELFEYRNEVLAALSDAG